jgi:hypothetical protein
LTATLRQALQKMPRPIDPEAPVLPQREPLVLTRAFTRLVTRLGLKDLTFHDLRHDAASTLAMAGVRLRTISEILGHRDMRMTTRYAHLSPQHLRDAMRALDDRQQSAADGCPGGDSPIGTIWTLALGALKTRNAGRDATPCFAFAIDGGLDGT